MDIKALIENTRTLQGGVKHGMAILTASRLRFGPLAEEVGLIVEMWAESLREEGFADPHGPHVVEACWWLARNQDEWPTLRELIARMKVEAKRRSGEASRVVQLEHERSTPKDKAIKNIRGLMRAVVTRAEQEQAS